MAVLPTYQEMILRPALFPVSFSYDGVCYHGFPGDVFPLVSHEEGQEKKCRRDILYFSGPKGLLIRAECAHYPDYGFMEWTLHFSAREETGVLSRVMCLDGLLPGEGPVLKGILGDHGNQYRPYEKDLAAESVHFLSDSGRPTHIHFPYFHLASETGGYLMAIGWAGTWQADFEKAEGGAFVRCQGVIDLQLQLQPGEEIRMPLMAVGHYQGQDDRHAMQVWRKWMIECNLPEFTRGEPMHAFSTSCWALDTGRPNSDGSISEGCDSWRPTLEKMDAIGVHPDFRWLDAGYYPDPDGNTVPTQWWETVGVWELDPVKWPGKTFLESVEACRERNMRTLMWFEPERVTYVEGLEKNYGYNPAWALQREGDRVITNNLGDPDCFRWTVGRIAKTLAENKIDMYREDNNGNPGPLWRMMDEKQGENRRGITELKMVSAHYRMWDFFIETTSGYGGCCFVDSCASGGGRNDLESMRRGVPLLRSDSDRTSTALRLSMNLSFLPWIPCCGANTREKQGELDPKGVTDPYTWRASYLPILNIDSQYVYEPEENIPVLQAGIKEWQSIRHLLLREFYPLTPWHAPEDKTGFTAYAFYDRERGEGALLSFRMEECTRAELPLDLSFAGGEMALLDADSGDWLETKGGWITLHFDGPRTAHLHRIQLKK